MFSTRPSPQIALLVGLLALIAFANALGSTLVFPLAPFMAADLGVPVNRTALASVCYSGAAGVGGVIGAFHMGRVSRRRAFIAALLGIAVTTGLVGFLPDAGFTFLLITRLGAGLCSGPLLALLVATAAELGGEGARARAVSAIIGAYGFALLLGAPISLALLHWSGAWQSAFAWLSGLNAMLVLPFLLGLFRDGKNPPAARRLGVADLWDVMRRPEGATGLTLTAAASFSTFLISPHLGSFAVANIGLNPSQLASVYLIGGTLSFASTGGTGWIIDRLGTVTASFLVASLISLLLFYAMILPQPMPGIMLALGTILAAQLGRSTVAQATASRVAPPQDSIAYQCLVSATTSAASALGAAVTTVLVIEEPNGHLRGMPVVAVISIALCWLSLALVMRLETRSAPAPVNPR